VRNACNIRAGNLEGKIPLRSRWRRWGYNTEIYQKEIVWEFMEWTDVAQDRDLWRALVETVMNYPVPYKVGFFFISWTTQLLKKDCAPLC
jgi:hypothetical protein